ncbi:glycosyl transferase [Helicobacter ganmani]|uniref:glycosyl transferase n=2 Tax=Helicobacter ganmani TaxID=60246 RepID=UPI003A890FF8
MAKNYQISNLDKSMKKYPLGILLCATCDSAFVIGALLANIKAKCADKVDIFYLIHDGFSESDKKALKQIAGTSEVKFETFTKEDFITKLNTYRKTPINLRNDSFLNRWTHMVYACFEGLKYLQECECVIYLDFDILLLHEIGHLKHLMGDYVLAANRGKNKLKASLPSAPQEFANLEIYRTRIIVFNDTLESPLECYDFIYSQSAKHALNDQAIFSLLIFEKKLKTKVLDNRYCGSVLWRKNQNPILIHAYGSKNRFWNNRLCNQIWQEWNLYYKQWLDASGSPNTKGFIANTTYGYERIRYHLSYKLGYAIIQNYKTLWGCLKLPFILAFIALKHRQEARFYAHIIAKSPHLKLPPLKSYDDYKSAIYEKQTFSYRLGASLIQACKTIHKGGMIEFYKQAKKLQKELREKNAPKILS